MPQDFFSTPGRRDEGKAPQIVHEALHTHGAPLDADTRSFFEPRFRFDFPGFGFTPMLVQPSLQAP
jgi:hypothetical protein